MKIKDTQPNLNVSGIFYKRSHSNELKGIMYQDGKIAIKIDEIIISCNLPERHQLNMEFEYLIRTFIQHINQYLNAGI